MMTAAANAAAFCLIGAADPSRPPSEPDQNAEPFPEERKRGVSDFGRLIDCRADDQTALNGAPIQMEE